MDALIAPTEETLRVVYGWLADNGCVCPSPNSLLVWGDRVLLGPSTELISQDLRSLIRLPQDTTDTTSRLEM